MLSTRNCSQRQCAPVGDSAVSLHPDSPAPSTRQRIVRQVRELIDDDPRDESLMAYFIAQAITTTADALVAP